MGADWTAAVAFAHVDPAQSPNVTSATLDVYFRSMVVAFASARRWNPGLALELVTDLAPPTAYAEGLARLDVRIHLTPFRHRPPEGFAQRFAASLFQLDALQACEGPTVFLDPDVLCLRPFDAMLREVGTERVGALPIGYLAGHQVNGLSRAEAQGLHVALGEPDGVPVHYGGECYAVPAGPRAQLVARAEAAWQDSLQRWRAGRAHFVTEEHLLSYALRGVDVLPLDPFVQRIWTAAKYRTVTGSEGDLTVWHLPAEKEHGFRELYPSATDRASWFWRDDDVAWRRKTARILGVSHRRPRRLLRDTAGRAVVALERHRPRSAPR